MSAIWMPSRPTPSMPEPISMMVAACVSCCRFSVIVSPIAVVAVNESGMFPTVMPEPLIVQAAFAALFTNTPLPTSAMDGPSRRNAARAMTAFFIMSSVSAQRLVEHRQAKQVAGRHGTRLGCAGLAPAAARRVVGWAGEEDRERHRVLRRHGFVVPD